MHRIAGALVLCSLSSFPALRASADSQRGAEVGECAVRLPDPAGPLPVGTSIERLVLRSRAGAMTPREVLVQYWYPRKKEHVAPSPTARYLAEPGLGAALLARRYYDQDSVLIRGWECARVKAALDAPPADGPYPLVTLSVGLGVIRANYSLLAADLASYGYIVVMVESPLAGLMMGARGEVVEDTSDAVSNSTVHALRVSDWARDLRLVLAYVDSAGGRTSELRRAVDWSHVGALGHSTGGLVAIQACEDSARFRACVDMDGGLVTPENDPLAPFVRAGTSAPVLVIRSRPLYSDADLAKRGLTREQWVKRGGAGGSEWDSLAARSRGRIVMAFIAGTGHMSFSDAPFVMPNTITRFGGRVIAPARGAAVVVRVIRAFFDQEFGRTQETVEAIAGTLPEVELKVLRP